jgi:hypothetical protein
MTGRALTDDRPALAGAGQGEVFPRSVPFLLASVYVLLFVIRPWERLFPWMAAVPVERIFALLMLASIPLSARTRLRFGAGPLAVLLFYGALVVSAFAGIDFNSSSEMLYKYATFIVFYFVLTWVLDSPYTLYMMGYVYVAANGLFIGKSLWEYLVHGGYRYTMGVKRLVGVNETFAHPNAVAATTVLTMPIWLAILRRRHEVTAHWPSHLRTLFNLSLWGYGALAVVVIVLTNSRSGMAAFVAFIGLSVLTGRSLGRKVAAGVAALLVLAMVWILMPDANRARFVTLWNPDAGPATAQASAEGRWEGMRLGLEAFSENPATGVGINNFIHWRQRFGDQVRLRSHSLLGQTLGETGLLGAAAFLLLNLVTVLYAHAAARSTRRNGPGYGSLGEFGLAARNVVLLLFFLGIGSHNLLRYNWLWAAAFAFVAAQLSRTDAHAARPQRAPAPARRTATARAGAAARETL